MSLCCEGAARPGQRVEALGCAARCRSPTGGGASCDKAPPQWQSLRRARRIGYPIAHRAGALIVGNFLPLFSSPSRRLLRCFHARHAPDALPPPPPPLAARDALTGPGRGAASRSLVPAPARRLGLGYGRCLGRVPSWLHVIRTPVPQPVIPLAAGHPPDHLAASAL